MNMVAGSTMSAICAVSVMNCSCTTMNRSSRAKPWRTRFCSGATVTGLVFWISIALTGPPPFKRDGIAGQDAADLGLVEPARAAVERVVAFDDGLVEMPQRVDC